MIRGIFLTMLLSVLVVCSSAQKGMVDDLEKMMTAGDFAGAQKALDTRIPLLLKSANPDTLIAYPKYIGKIVAKLQDDAAAIAAVSAFAAQVRAAQVPFNALFRVNIESAVFYSLKGKHAMAYETVEKIARELSVFLASSPMDAALAEAELGVYGYRMGNVGLSGKHHRKATAILESLPEPNYERMYNSYNSMGTIMWLSSKLDSGIYYFDKSIAALKKLPATPENRNYRVGIVQNNLSQLYNEQGRTAEAIHTLEEGLLNVKVFIASKEPNPKKDFAIVRQYQFIDNLARVYRHIGDFSRAEYLLNYSFRGKQKDIPTNMQELYISQISIGGLYYEQMDYKKAEKFLMDGLKMVQSEPVPSLLWSAEACNALSRVYDALDNQQLAAQFFRQTDSLYELSYQGEYDETYLDFLRESSLFYARQHQDANAVAKASKGLEYIRKTQGMETLSAQQQVLNMATVDFQLGNYTRSLELSRQALGIVNKRISASTQLLDSIKAEMSKPSAILLMTKAEYRMLPAGDVAGLKRLLAQLTEALDVLQRKRAVIKDADDINLLMSQHRELLDFTKELQVKLFELTGDQAMIDDVIDLHETAIYNRIRARLDKQRAVRFAEIPAGVQAKEEQLIAAVTGSLRSGRNESEAMQRYFVAEKNWKEFQDMLRKQYPRYYAMRYADIGKRKVDELSRFVPEGVTVVRFLNIGKNYYALVADNKKHNWVSLDASGADNLIRELAGQDAGDDLTFKNCYSLYTMLWRPIEKFISNKRVMVIPDGSLYYLSFEMLTAKPVSDAARYVKSSLL
ncbi:MAG: tetratricopeptide repeat protein, partial [Chitinophagaceae bacterium]